MFFLSGYNEFFTINNVLLTLSLDSGCETLSSFFGITSFWFYVLEVKRRELAVFTVQTKLSTKLGNRIHLCLDHILVTFSNNIFHMLSGETL